MSIVLQHFEFLKDTILNFTEFFVCYCQSETAVVDKAAILSSLTNFHNIVAYPSITTCSCQPVRDSIPLRLPVDHSSSIFCNSTIEDIWHHVTLVECQQCLTLLAGLHSNIAENTSVWCSCTIENCKRSYSRAIYQPHSS